MASGNRIHFFFFFIHMYPTNYLYLSYFDCFSFFYTYHTFFFFGQLIIYLITYLLIIYWLHSLNSPFFSAFCITNLSWGYLLAIAKLFLFFSSALVYILHHAVCSWSRQYHFVNYIHYIWPLASRYQITLPLSVLSAPHRSALGGQERSLEGTSEARYHLARPPFRWEIHY